MRAFAIPVKIRNRKHSDSEGGKTPDIFTEMEEKWIDTIAELKQQGGVNATQLQQQSDSQLEINFDEVISSAEVHSRPQEGTSQEYDPLATTAEYMRHVVEIEQAWETTFQKARETLLQTKPQQLYFDFLMDLKHEIEQNSSKSEALSKLLEAVAIRGLGMSKQQIRVSQPSKGGTRRKVDIDAEAVQKHLDDHILGEYFLNPITIDETVWDGRLPVIGASDVSQHRSAVPDFFRRIPFVLNNAAGTLYTAGWQV